MRITKRIEKEENILSDIGENMLKVLKCKASKGYKNKNKQRQNDKNLCLNMHNRRGFIMIADFKLTCRLSYILILKQ